ncbi:MAG: guanylate kinase [Bdellovibrionota bacterium]
MARAERQPILFCFCGPAASGKSTIANAVASTDPRTMLSISTTTRAPRGAERDGIEYHFVSHEEFTNRIRSGAFIEHAEYSGKLYGTEKRNVLDASANGKDLLLDIEVEGVKQMKQLYGPAVVTIFVFPPSLAVLEERLRKRGTEDEQKIQSRLNIARAEIAVLRSSGFSDYLIVNDDLAAGIESAFAIVRAERIRFTRAPSEQIERVFGGG